MSLSINNTSSEEDISMGSIPNRLYSHEFEAGRFFQVVHQDENGFEIKNRIANFFLYIMTKNL